MILDIDIASTINAHHLTNPPAERRGSYINFDFVNMNHLQIKELSNDSQTVLEIKIPNPRQIFFKGSDDNELDHEIKNLLLAMNFTLKRACVTTRSFFITTSINPKTNPDSSMARVIKENKETRVLINHSLSMRDSISITIRGKEVFDEHEVLKIFKKLQDYDSARSNNISNNTIKQYLDMEKALNEYTQAMESIDRLSKFKHLFNSLELIVNSDRSELSGIFFDKEVNNLTNVPENKVATWHEFYNRAKHKNRNDIHVQTFIDGIDDLTNWLPDLKECCSKIISMKL